MSHIAAGAILQTPRAVRLHLRNRSPYANPVIGTGGPRKIRLGVKAVF